MPDNDTDNTATTDANTDKSGHANSGGAENKGQDAQVSRLRDLESQVAKFAELEAARNSLENQAKVAKAEAMRWESSYRSLQANTTASLQEAARNRQQLAEQQKVTDELAATRSDLRQLQEGLSFLASKVVDEDSAREFSHRQREMQLRQAEEAAKARIVQLQTAAQAPQYQNLQNNQSTQFIDPDDQKRQFVQYYFPDSGVDHNNPAIDWGEGASTTQEAFRRFTTSVMKIRDDRQKNPDSTSPQSETQKLLEEIRKEREELEKAKNNVTQEVKELTRREVEERLRRTGADAGNSGSTSGSAGRVATRLNEVDERKLMTGEPSARKRAAKDMEEEIRILREEYLSNYQK